MLQLAAAEVVVFDTAQHPDGYRHAIVTGQTVVQDGLRSSERSGRVLRAGL